MRFGSGDAVRLVARPDAWLEGPLTLALPGLDDDSERLPVRLVHVTQQDSAKRECQVGLTYDRARMKPAQVLQLLETWRRFSSTRR
jgi:hypothetical protein